MKLFLQMLVAMISTTRQSTEISAIQGLLCAALEGIAERDWGARQEEVEQFIADAYLAMNRRDRLVFLMDGGGFLHMEAYLRHRDTEPPVAVAASEAGELFTAHADDFAKLFGPTLHPRDCLCPACDDKRRRITAIARTAMIEEGEAEASIGGSSVVEAEMAASGERVLDEEERHEPDDPFCGCPSCRAAR